MLRVNLVHQGLPAYRVPVWRALARRPGIDLTVYHAQKPGLPSVEADGFRAVPIRDRSSNPLRAMVYPKLMGLATRSRSEVLMATWTLRSTLLVPAVLRARMSGVGTVLWGHGYSKRERPSKLWLRERQGLLADALLFYEEKTAADFRARHPRFRGAFVATNTLDLDAIEAARARSVRDPGATLAARQSLGLPTDERRPIALHVSRLEEDNGVDLLIEATARVEGLITLVVGAGPREPELRELTRQLGVEGRVRFLGDMYEERELAPLFAISSVFVYPRNVGLSAIHALAHGLPVVVGDHIASHNPEIHAVRQGVNGVLFPHDDPEALATTIRGLVSSPQTLAEMAERARDQVHIDFPLKAMVDGLEASIRFASAQAKG